MQIGEKECAYHRRRNKRNTFTIHFPEYECSAFNLFYGCLDEYRKKSENENQYIDN